MHCGVRNTPPQFAVNARKIIVQSVLTHMIMETKVVIKYKRCHICCAIGIDTFGLVSCAL